MRWRPFAGLAIPALLVLPAILNTPSPIVDIRSADGLGMSRFAGAVADDDRALATVFASQAALRHVDRVAIIVVPGAPRPLTDGERQALADELSRGTSLWVLDETGNANALLAPSGLAVRPLRLLDAASPFDDPVFVEATAELDGRDYRIILTNATSLEVVNATLGHPLALTSPNTFLDLDGSGTIEHPPDRGGAAVVLASSNAGGGRLLVSSDAGLFTNTVLGAPGFENGDLLAALLAGEPAGDVVVDTSRHEPQRAFAPLKAAISGTLRVTSEPLALALVVLAALGLTALVALRAPRRLAWGEHRHTLGEALPAPADPEHARLRRALVSVLHDASGRDAAELLGLTDNELADLAKTHLPRGQDLSARGEIGARFGSLLKLLEPARDPGGPTR